MRILRTKRLTGAFFSFIFVFALSHNGLSQYYTAGIDPASVQWNHITTEHFNLIYPVSFEKHAQYVANGLEHVYAPCAKTIYLPDTKTPVPKMPVIIHNQTTIPSSVTPYAPKRMDFFTTPPQDMYPQDWVDQLIIHEFRHASQYAAINHGFTKSLSYLLGEQGTFAATGLFMPLWFIEGDATAAETALHSTGRGRTPSFEMHLRAQFLEKSIYSYEKATSGSYRNFVPDKYELGYQLVGLSRYNYGADIWGNVLSDAGRYSHPFRQFSSSIKKQTGLDKYGLYDSLTCQMQKRWKDEISTLCENNYQVLTNNSAVYTNYNLPVIVKDSLIIAVKSQFGDLPQVIRLDKNGNERKLFTAGAKYLLESMSSSDSMLYWSEMTSDPRWSFRDYRVIKSYNYTTGKTRQLTHRTRYYAPSVTRDGTRIAAVNVTLDNNYYLVILNAHDGSVIKEITTSDNLLFIHPQWAHDGKSIVSVVLGKEGNSLAVVDPQTGDIELLLPFSSMEIKRPSFYKNSILYQASYNGVDNLYCLNRTTKEITQVTSARFGAADAYVTKDQKAVIYSNYTADGYQIVKASLDPEKWCPFSVPENSAFPLAENLTQQENFIYDPDSVLTTAYEPKPYRKELSLFNFHSWAPLGIDIQNTTAYPGITLLSQNLLSTNVAILGYVRDINQKTNKYYLSLTNETFYPAIDCDIDYGDRRNRKVNALNDTLQVRWNEFNVTPGIRIPLKWSHNEWLREFEPEINVNYKSVNINKTIPFQFKHRKIIAPGYSIKTSNQMKMSLRDLYPRWGQQLQLNFNNTPFGDGSNSILAGQLTLDFPGVAKNHGLRLYGGYQSKKEECYSFADYVQFPRCHDTIFRNELYSFSAYYSMPLFLPDWQIKHFLYIKRFKAAAFYDFARNTDKVTPGTFSSAGLDCTMDFTLFNFIAPFDAGLRSAYIPETGKMKFQLLFAVNVNSIY